MDFQPVGTTFISKDHQIMMCCSDKKLFDKIFLLGCHRSHPSATTALLAVGIGVKPDVYKRQPLQHTI